MSRGLGRMQRRILDELDKCHKAHGPVWVWVPDLIEMIGGTDRSTVVSANRAIRTLAKAGDVVLRRVPFRRSHLVVQRADLPSLPALTERDEAFLLSELQNVRDDCNSAFRKVGFHNRLKITGRPEREYARVLHPSSGEVRSVLYLNELDSSPKLVPDAR